MAPSNVTLIVVVFKLPRQGAASLGSFGFRSFYLESSPLDHSATAPPYVRLMICTEASQESWVNEISSSFFNCARFQSFAKRSGPSSLPSVRTTRTRPELSWPLAGSACTTSATVLSPTAPRSSLVCRPPTAPWRTEPMTLLLTSVAQTQILKF